jgi:hypothetical protein
LCSDESAANDKVDDIFRGINLERGYVLRDAQANRAKELIERYMRRESGAVALIDDILAEVGTTIDALIASRLQARD